MPLASRQYYYRLESHSEQLKPHVSFCSHLLKPKTLQRCISSLQISDYDIGSIFLPGSNRIVRCLFHSIKSIFPKSEWIKMIAYPKSQGNFLVPSSERNTVFVHTYCHVLDVKQNYVYELPRACWKSYSEKTLAYVRA